MKAIETRRVDFNERLERIEKRLQRESEHRMNVMASQRQIVGNAFEQVQVSLLEQEMIVRSHALNVQEQINDLTEFVRDLGKKLGAIEQKHDPAA